MSIYEKLFDGFSSFLKEFGITTGNTVKLTKSVWNTAIGKYDNRVRELYGTIRVLGKDESVPLEGIFTDVYILDKLRAFHRFDIMQLRADPESMDREATRVNGLNLVKEAKNKRLFILGKPGAGKTTFLKYITLKAINGELNQLPVFVSLKEWADSGLELMPFLIKQFDICGLPDAGIFVEFLLKRGEAIVLFDGLDEVKQEAQQRDKMIAALRDFSNKYWETRCLITCRIAATDYSFDHFKYIELADFTDDQKRDYAAKWFRDDAAKLKLFNEEFDKPENENLREIASQPILLALLCISFDATLSFPQRRVDLYEDALEALLKKWDTSHSIKRDEIYRGLSLGRKRQMFARIAAQTFQDDEYFLPQGKLAKQIVAYMRQLPDVKAEDEIDGDAILKAIEAQHGIFTERAHRIYSFSHKTFQEYFAAKHIIEDSSGHALRGLLSVKNITDDRWREVTLLTASLLDNANIFFEEFNKSIGRLIEDECTIIQLLQWSKTQTESIQTNKRAIVVRLFYFTLAQCVSLDHVIDLSQHDGRANSVKLLLTLLLANELDMDIRNALTHIITPINPYGFLLDFFKDNAYKFDLDLDLDLDWNLCNVIIFIVMSKDMYEKRILKNFTLDNIDKRMQKIIGLSHDAELAGELNKLLLAGEWHKETDRFIEELRKLIQIYRNIGHKLTITEGQSEKLTNYFRANHLLIECLKLAVVTDRNLIEDGLLLPPNG